MECTQCEKKEIRAYLKRCAAKAEKAAKEYDPEDIETSLVDLLANVMHLARLRKWDFYDLCDRARTHFNAEVRGGEHG